MSNLKKIEGGVTTPQGFTAGATYTAIKKRENKKPDVAVLYSDLPCSCAACFTTNKFCAAPVILDREILKKGKARAVVINSGNANAATGKQGNDKEDHKPARIAFFFLRRRIVRLRHGFLACTFGHIDRAYRANGIDCACLAFVLTGANGGSLRLAAAVLHERHQVGFVHLIEKMYGVFALGGAVNDDVKVVAVFALHNDKLLVPVSYTHLTLPTTERV